MAGMDRENVELLAVTQDDETVVACAATTSLSDRGSALVGLVLPPRNGHPSPGPGLFDYLAWELGRKNKTFLVIDPPTAQMLPASIVAYTGCDPTARTIIKLDWKPALSPFSPSP